jgi:hypothetical protein
MSVEQAVVQLLKADTAVAALVGTKIYPQIAPQNKVYPYIIYHLVTQTVLRHLGSASNLNYERQQLDLYADTYEEVKDLEEKVFQALDGFRGLVTYTGGTQFIQYLAKDDGNDINVPIESGSDVPRRRTSVDYIVGRDIIVPTH